MVHVHSGVYAECAFGVGEQRGGEFAEDGIESAAFASDVEVLRQTIDLSGGHFPAPVQQTFQ